MSPKKHQAIPENLMAQFRIRDFGFRIFYFGFWISDFRFQILGFRFWISDFGFVI